MTRRVVHGWVVMNIKKWLGLGGLAVIIALAAGSLDYAGLLALFFASAAYGQYRMDKAKGYA